MSVVRFCIGCSVDVKQLRDRAEKAEAKLALLEERLGDSVAKSMAKARARDLLDALAYAATKSREKKP